MIPFYSDPYDGELLYSWICRLTELNHLPLKSFGHSYLGIKSVNKDTLPPDARGVFGTLSGHIPDDAADLFLKTSTFRFEAMAMTPEVQTRYLNNITYEKDALNHTVPGLFNKVCYCPACAAEDKEKYGKPILHAMHHLSGVKCCPVHGAPLMYANGTGTYALSRFREYEDVTDSDAAFAKYAYALYNAKADTDIYDVKNIVTERYEDLGYIVSNGYAPLIRDLNQWKHGVIWGAYGSDQFLKVKLNKARNVTMTELVSLLMFLYPNPEDFLAALPDHEPLIETYTCFTCGKTYMASPTAMRQGWGCPECNKDIPAADRFKSLVNTIGNGEYELTSEFNSMAERVTMKHSCGRELSISPEYFLFRRGRCTCTADPFNPQEKVAAHSGFKLVSYNGAHSVCTIFHQVCDREFECNFYKFLEAPKCRLCEPTRFTQESYVKAVQDLVGDEYTVTGEYQGRQKRIDIRHNLCGTTRSYEAAAFLKGTRCPDCAEKHGFIDLEEALDTYSKGRYVLNKAAQGWEVFDIYTGESVTLTKNELLQEINRPTPSPVLPLDGTEDDGWIPYWYRMYTLLTAYRNVAGSVRMNRNLWFEGQPLGLWKARQVELLTGGLLSEEKASLLADVGIMPVKQLKSYGLSSDDNWNRRALQLGRYVKINGPGYIRHSVVFEDELIGIWVESQRQKHARGELSKKRVAILNAIDPSALEPNPDPYGYDKTRSEWISLFKAFIDEKGISELRWDTVYREKNLGLWVYTQRRKLRSGALPLEAAEPLISLAPEFFNAAPPDNDWGHRCDQYEQCLKEKGVIRYHTVYDDFMIGVWAYAQRRKYRHGTLSQERADRLLSIDKDFLMEETAVDMWDTICGYYEDFVKEYGPVPIPKDYIVGGRNLNKWITYQRKRYREGKLEPGRVARLTSINESVLTADLQHLQPDEQWHMMFDLYKEYIKETGEYYLVYRTEFRGRALGHWFGEQRRRHREGNLRKEREELLLSVNPDMFAPGPRDFDRHFDDYVRYVKETGMSIVPYSATLGDWDVGRWFNKQVAAYHKGTMPEERIRRFLSVDKNVFNECDKDK